MTLIRGGVVYDFPNTGDVLAAHQHDEGSQHLTAVLAGSFRHTYGAVDEILRAGEIIASPVGVDHTIEAMEPGGLILNVASP